MLDPVVVMVIQPIAKVLISSMTRGVLGDEDLIRKPWELLEIMGYAWIWQWVL
ncbi:MAG: hypothetical protein IMW93_08680 [Thermoanaerobacteraceae bacterium]|nr:hypothetical protein [Thermoanaerobacteraceae bacterium]